MRGKDIAGKQGKCLFALIRIRATVHRFQESLSHRSTFCLPTFVNREVADCQHTLMTFSDLTFISISTGSKKPPGKHGRPESGGKLQDPE